MQINHDPLSIVIKKNVENWMNANLCENWWRVRVRPE